jgi:hypothetical protein
MNNILIQETKKISPKGYILIRFDNEWIIEHKFVIEQFIKRPLNFDEVVHHTDFDKTNNSLSNLCLFTNKQHSHFHRQILQFGYTRPRQLEVFNNIIQKTLREQNE